MDMVSCPLALHSHNYAAIILLMSRVCFTRYEAEPNLIRSFDKVVATFELLCVAKDRSISSAALPRKVDQILDDALISYDQKRYQG